MKFRDSLRPVWCDSVADTLVKPRCRHGVGRPIIGPFWESSPRQKGAMLLQRMVMRPSVCLRRLARGRRSQQVGFGRFLANRKVTIERLITSWSDQTAGAVAGRHVLAIQDTSEVNFRTKPGRRRGLGEIGKGSGRGVLVHAMLAVDADSGGCLGQVGGSVYTRTGRIKTPHAKRSLKDKE